MGFPGWLSKAATLLTVLVASLAISSGCSGKREVTGQVFVVTKGGENVKLGLVGIHVVGEPQLREIATRLLVEAATTRKDTLGGSMIGRLMGRLAPALTQTDADGVFVVEAGQGDWLVARGQRQAGGSTEEYLWLIPLKGVEKKLLVSNDRVLDDDDELLKALAVNFPAAEAEVQAAKERALAEARAKAEAARVRLAGGGRFEVGESLVLGISVRWIPAGRFRMGSPSGEEGRNSDEVAHEVVLSRGFFMAETECTQGQWEAVMGSNPSNFKGQDHPVEKVSWEEAVDYCRKLTAQQRAAGILPEGWEWRLPTEAEWEYAARAGTTGARYGELAAIAWHEDNSGSQTHPVKQKTPNAWGLHDMMGNVWEWCADWYGDYPTGAVTDPTGPSSGSYRVTRGGSWGNGARFVRSADRNGNFPGDRSYDLGFRPALSSVR